MTNWLEGYAEANGIRIHYHRTGGAKPQLLLLHGMTDNGLCWTPVARKLESDYDVIMPDARGHGLSGGPEDSFSNELLAADAAAFIQALGLERPYVLGHSMGGATALFLAANYPDLMRTILLEDPPLRDDIVTPKSEGEIKSAGPHPYQWLLTLREMSLEERMNDERGRTNWTDEELLPWAQSKAQLDLRITELSRRSPLQTGGWRDVISGLRCPFLLITGEPEREAIVGPKIASEVGKINPRGQVVFIPKAGHNIRRDQQAAYLDIVRYFLQEH